MSALGELIARRIAQSGPMTLADYMHECLLHPEHGYYTARTPFGRSGDFITAPEISQMFGELIGLALASHWIQMGRPKAIVAELGPGRGTLMADILRATKGVAQFHQAISVVLVEASLTLRAQQRKALSGYDVEWRDDLNDLESAPLLLVANEFFDALPIRQFTRTADGWAETMVGLRGAQLAFGRSAPAPLAVLAPRLADTIEGDIVEHCPAAAVIAAHIGAHIERCGGLGLIIDYGGWNGLGDTFQALSAHEYVGPLAAPGHADLTAHVDFAALAAAAAPARHVFCSQAAYLTELGLIERTRALAAHLSGAALDNHISASKRLTDADKMGFLFKVLGLYAASGPQPLGFTASQ